MTSLGDQPASGPRRVRPYAMTGGRTRPTHDDLEIETLVCTTSTGEQTPKLTVEQRATADLSMDRGCVPAETNSVCKSPSQSWCRGRGRS